MTQLFVIGWKCAAHNARRVFDLPQTSAGPFLNIRISLAEVAHYIRTNFASFLVQGQLYQPSDWDKQLPAARAKTPQTEARQPYIIPAEDASGGSAASVFVQPTGGTCRLRHQFHHKGPILTDYHARSAALKAAASRLMDALKGDAPVMLVHFVWDIAESQREIIDLCQTLEKHARAPLRVALVYQETDYQKAGGSWPVHPLLRLIPMTKTGLKSMAPSGGFLQALKEGLRLVGDEVGLFAPSKRCRRRHRVAATAPY